MVYKVCKAFKEWLAPKAPSGLKALLVRKALWAIPEHKARKESLELKAPRVLAHKAPRAHKAQWVAKAQPEPAPTPKANVASLTWTPPTQNNDGSPLDNLASYRLYYGTAASQLNKVITIANGQSSYTVTDLQPATYYFALSAVNTAGLESALSDIRSKSIQ